MYTTSTLAPKTIYCSCCPNPVSIQPVDDPTATVYSTCASFDIHTYIKGDKSSSTNKKKKKTEVKRVKPGSIVEVVVEISNLPSGRIDNAGR